MKRLFNVNIVMFVILVAGVLRQPAFDVIGQNEGDGNVTIHVVQRGESLYYIAQVYELNLDDLIEANGIADPGSIKVGERLIIPIAPEIADRPEEHVVEAGETLFSIAQFYDMAMDELAAINGIVNADTIYGGQVLKLEGEPIIQPISASDGVDVIHVVQRGETLFRIASNYGTTLENILETNEIETTDTIYAGQTLTIPNITIEHLTITLPNSITNLQIKPSVFTEGQSGGITLTTQIPSTVSATFLSQETEFFSNPEQTNHSTILGIPLQTPAGLYPINIRATDQNNITTTIETTIHILTGLYGTQYITIPEEQANLLNPTIEQNELSILQSLTSNQQQNRQFNTPFSLPTTGIMNAPYGASRAYNGSEPDRFHYGADFASNPGTPILAPAQGTVIMADTLNIRGNSVMIDHGWGIFTVYSHMNEIQVQLGQNVERGQTIGTVGNTGRTTGAHLHWELWVNGVVVDPLQWTILDFP